MPTELVSAISYKIDNKKRPLIIYVLDYGLCYLKQMPIVEEINTSVQKHNIVILYITPIAIKNIYAEDLGLANDIKIYITHLGSNLEQEISNLPLYKSSNAVVLYLNKDGEASYSNVL